MSERKSKRRVVLALVAGTVMAALVVAGALLWLRRNQSAGEEQGAELTFGGTSVSGAPEQGAPVAMDSLSAPPSPAVVLSVYDANVLAALMNNAWLREVAAQPLGKGFLGSWAAFLGTRGEDLRAEFKGKVLELMASEMLAQPFQIVWLAGRDVAGSPALVVPDAKGKALAAFAALDQVAGRGTFTVESCSTEKSDAVRDLEGITIRRWLIADHAIYAALADDRLVLGRRPSVVLQGLCAVLPAPEAPAGVAVDVALKTAALGRDAQLLTHLLGIDASPRLAFGLEGGNLVPRGISAGVVVEGRLAAGPLSEEMLRLLPEEAPVVLALQINLPKELTRDNLSAYFAGQKTPLAPRQAALVWYPAGADKDTELALIWSQKQDREALAGIFVSGLQAAKGAPCNHLVLASSDAVRDRVTKSCDGRIPSLLHAAAAIAAGFKSPMSVGLGVHLGRTLARLTVDAFKAEIEGDTLPPEMEKARQQLETLPFLGLSGRVEGAKLVPGGFRS